MRARLGHVVASTRCKLSRIMSASRSRAQGKSRLRPVGANHLRRVARVRQWYERLAAAGAVRAPQRCSRQRATANPVALNHNARPRWIKTSDEHFEQSRCLRRRRVTRQLQTDQTRRNKATTEGERAEVLILGEDDAKLGNGDRDQASVGSTGHTSLAATTSWPAVASE